MRRRKESAAEAAARRTGRSVAEHVREARKVRSSPQEDKLWDMVVATAQYGLSEVAEILHIPEWRVKNFALGAAYGIKPRTVGKKRLRVFGWLDLARVEIANELVEDGFAPKDVGKAISALPEKMLRPSKPETYLVRAAEQWSCEVGHNDVKELVSRAIGEPEETEFPSVYFLNVTAVMARLAGKWEPWRKVPLGVGIPKAAQKSHTKL